MLDTLVPFGSLLQYPLRSGVTIAKNSHGTGIRMVNMGELFKYPRLGDVDMHLVPLRVEDAERYLLRTGDLLFARRSLTIEGAGKCSVIIKIGQPTTWESSIIRARLDPNIADPFYYYYYFSSPQGRTAVETIVEQVAAAGVRSSDLNKLLVPHPALESQQAIAEVLGALDDKIAVNGQLCRTALSLADSIFDTATRRIPAGPATFGSTAKVSGGGTPRTSEPSYWGGGVSWATPSDVTPLQAPYLFNTNKKITNAGLEGCASQLYPAGSIFMTSRATIGAFAINQVPAAVNQGFIVVVPPEERLRWWLFHEMRSRVDEMLGLANGSTFLELSRKNFKSMPIRLPEPDKISRFFAQVDPIHRKAATSMEESFELAEARDALLPKLMSGEIRVKDAEKIVEDVT